MIKPAVKYGEPCPFCGHEGELRQKTLELWYVECCYCEARTGLYDYESDALDAWNDRTPKHGYWERSQDDDANVWQCSECGEELPTKLCSECEADTIAAWNTRTEHCGYWMRHDESDTWECPSCHACFDLDGGTPKDKYLNYCPVCGTKLKPPE